MLFPGDIPQKEGSCQRNPSLTAVLLFIYRSLFSLSVESAISSCFVSSDCAFAACKPYPVLTETLKLCKWEFGEMIMGPESEEGPPHSPAAALTYKAAAPKPPLPGEASRRSRDGGVSGLGLAAIPGFLSRTRSSAKCSNPSGAARQLP